MVCSLLLDYFKTLKLSASSKVVMLNAISSCNLAMKYR